MRGSCLLAWMSVALAAGVACAASEDGASPGPEVTPPPAPADAEPVDAGHEATGPKGPATCSGAGWCVTPLPDADLTLIDIWPFLGRAFAIAESGTLGVKVMEWIDADRQWTYIDDNTQNENGFGKYAGRLWAPNENEVYYAVAPGYVYHGKRAGAWTWERRRLPIDGSGIPGFSPAAAPGASVALGVWGTSADDVYAWQANTIFHLQSIDGGEPEWIPEYVGLDDEQAGRVFILSAGGSGKDDVWFGGGRGYWSLCPLVIRKTPEGYRHVFDGVASYSQELFTDTCDALPGSLRFDAKAGALTEIQATAPGRIVALRSADTVTRVVPDGDGGYAAASTTFPSSTNFGASKTTFYSLWVNGDDAWLSGEGLILHGPPAGDAGAYGISTVALSGAPLDKPLYRLRGTANDNLWAIGARYAFHKTTP